MGNEKKRQIKTPKLKEALLTAHYNIVEWYIDTSNIVKYFLVRNVLNNLDLICYVPDNILMTSETGLYLSYSDSPDFELAKSLWNELSLTDLKTFAIKVDSGLILKREEWESYTYSTDKKHTNEIEEIATTFIGLDESNVKISNKEPAIQIVEQHQTNPFDVLLDNGEYKYQNTNSRVEDSQPSILINYKGFTYGQVVPLVNIVTLTKELQGYEHKQAKWQKEIFKYQTVKIKSSGNDAVLLLTNFTESLKKSLAEWDTQWSSSEDKLSRIQSILEKSHSSRTSSDIQNKANDALRQTIEELLEKRDKLISLLTLCKDVFGQI